jgi:hypothetical protein
LRIDAAGVGHDLDVVGQAFRQDAPHDVEEIARVTGVRVARPCFCIMDIVISAR